MSKISEKEDSTDSIERIFYIIIFFTKAKDSEPSFATNSKDTKSIFSQKENANGNIRHIILLKHKCYLKNGSKNIELKLNNKGEIFKISFVAEESDFIFNPTLTIKKNKTANEKNITQMNVFKISKKIDIFVNYLEKENENSKLGTLYNDGVDFFKLNKDYELLIYLFIKLFEAPQKYKDVCKKLLNIFWDCKISDVNEDIEEKNQSLILNRSETYKQYLEKIKEINSKSEKFIYENGFDKAKFYGFILLYLNTCDNKQFLELEKKLQEQKEKEKEKEKEKDNFFFGILAHFSSNFSEIKVNLEEYVDYLIGKNFQTLEKNGFAYFNSIEEFFKIINKKKEKLAKMKNFKTLKIPKQLNYDLINPEKFIKELEDILDFSINQKQLLVFLSGSFWKEMTKVLGKPSADNIYNLFQLRKNFKKYLEFVKTQYKPEHAFYKNAEETDGKDEIAVILNSIIQKNIEESKEISNDEIINQITKFDIYYIEDNYINRRELNFLDRIDFDDKENDWINSFKESKFENIFSNDIDNFILKLVSKIRKLEDLGRVINIINEDEIKKMNKMDYLIGLLRRKALNLMKNSDSLKGLTIENEKLLALKNLFIIIYKHTEKVQKLKEIIDKLENETKHIIFIELLKEYPDNQPLEDYIFDFYINNINIYYKNINELFENLSEKNIKNFMERISDTKEDKKKNYRIITFDNFFMDDECLNINLLQELIKNIDKIKKTYYYGECKKVIQQIYDNFEKKKLEIKYLSSLLRFSPDNVIKRLEILKILNQPFDPKDKYNELKKKYDEAQKEIIPLEKISESLKIFHSDFHQNDIRNIEAKINKLNTGTIKEFDDKSELILGLGEEIIEKVKKIDLLKESSIFRKLFNKTQAINQDEQFKLALKNLKDEFLVYKKRTKTMDEQTKREMQIIVEVLGLKEDEKTQQELKYMEDSSGAEEDIKCIIYFCQNIKLNDSDNIPKKEGSTELEDFLRVIYENIKNNKEKKENLNKLKGMGIYDCQQKGNVVEFFNLFYGQKEAIDFLLTKTHDNLEYIKDKLISIDNTVKTSDIDKVDSCIDFFNNKIKSSKNKYDMFGKIKDIDDNMLNNFKNFIKIFQYLVELDNNSDNSYNLYIESNKYFSNAKYNINLKGEEYRYTYKDPLTNKIEEKSINLKKIKSIKHKINIPNEIEIKLKNNQDFPEGQEKNSLMKTLLLLKYKEVVGNIELIEQFFFVFNKKGCSLPIEIEINIKYPEITYFLKKK